MGHIHRALPASQRVHVETPPPARQLIENAIQRLLSRPDAEPGWPSAALLAPTASPPLRGFGRLRPAIWWQLRPEHGAVVSRFVRRAVVRRRPDDHHGALGVPEDLAADRAEEKAPDAPQAAAADDD